MKNRLYLIQKAFLAQAALEKALDAPTLQLAAWALDRYAQTMLRTTPEDLEAVLAFRDSDGKGVPTLGQLHQDYLARMTEIYFQAFPEAKAAGF